MIKNPLLRNTLAVLGGLVVGFIVVTILETIGHVLFPLPEGIDPMSVESIKANMHLVPIGSFLFVAIAHFFGIICAMLVARRISRQSFIPSYIVASVMVALTVLNLMLLPHPFWFLVVDIIAVDVGAAIGFFLMNTLEGDKVYELVSDKPDTSKEDQNTQEQN